MRSRISWMSRSRKRHHATSSSPAATALGDDALPQLHGSDGTAGTWECGERSVIPVLAREFLAFALEEMSGLDRRWAVRRHELGLDP